MIEVYEVDINKTYFLDAYFNIWEDINDFYDYHIEDYTGIKDNIERWQEELEEDYKLTELRGDEVIAKVVADLEDSVEYYKEKYYKEMEKSDE